MRGKTIDDVLNMPVEEGVDSAPEPAPQTIIPSLGADPEGMVDHLKGIPREMITIVANDPKTLDSYESFLVALRGPR